MPLINEQALQSYIKQQVISLLDQYKPKEVNQRLFNRRDAAKYLGISVSKLDKEREQGRIKPVFPFGGKTRFYLREELDQIADEAKEYRKKAEL